MSDLIARLEKCGAIPDRELNGDILVAVGGPLLKRLRHIASLPSGCPEPTLTKDAKRMAPDYTSSVDAALTLVPEGWGWSLVSDSNIPSAAVYRRGVVQEAYNGHSVFPSTALCIAALKAKGIKT